MTTATAESDRFWFLVQRDVQDALTPEEAGEFERLVLADQQRAGDYLQYLRLHADLSLWSREARAFDATLHNLLLSSPQLLDSPLFLDSPSRETVGRRVWQTIRDFANDSITLSALIAGLTMTIILLSLALIVPNWERAAPSVAEIDPPRPAVVARVTATHEATWDAASDANFKNIELFSGERLVLNSGLAEVTFDNGAVVMLHSPCDFVMESAQLAELRSGKLTARYEGEDRGFRVRTSVAEITDLGTEFGVSAGEDDVCLVHVFEGAVEVVALHHTDIRTLRAGETLLVDAERSLPVSDRPIAFFRVAQSDQVKAGKVIADARADFAKVAEGETTQTQNRPGLPSSGGGYWNYYQSKRPNPSDPEAELELLRFGPAGTTRDGMFHGTEPTHIMPAISATQIFDSGVDAAPRPDELAIHPGNQDAKFVVMRWTPADRASRVIYVRGHVRILGTDSTTDGVTFRLLVGGKTIREQRLAAADNKGISFAQPIQLDGNEMIEFIFDPNTNYYNDQLGFAAMIEEVDQGLRSGPDHEK